MRIRALITLLLALLWCVSCANKPASSGARATVTLRTGESYSGLVTASTPAQITVACDDNQTRTFDLRTVKSVEYADIAQAPPPQATPQPAPSQPPPPAPDQSAPPPDADHQDHYHPSDAAIQTKTYVVPAGAHIAVRTEETIDSARAVAGQTFAAEVTRDVLDAGGAVVIPRASNAQIVIRSASKGGRFHGASDLIMDLASVSVDGRRYRLQTADIVRQGKQGVGENRRTAKFAGSGAAIGAIIGAIAGRGKGAAIGAASGAGAGLASEVVSKGRAIRVPVESILTFRLDAPLRVTAAQE